MLKDPVLLTRRANSLEGRMGCMGVCGSLRSPPQEGVNENITLMSSIFFLALMFLMKYSQVE